jgi:hypothetical protein
MVAARLLQVGRIALCLAASAPLCALHGQISSESGKSSAPDSTSKVILEVVNNHFTMGRKIPSIYLRLFSDGTAECHAVSFTGDEQETVKKERLSPKEFEKIRVVLNQPGLRDVKGRYDLPRIVFDSWMEWDVTSHDSQLVHDVTVSFGPDDRDLGPFPEALGNLGCQILKIREYVYGDRTDYYRPACVTPANHRPQK